MSDPKKTWTNEEILHEFLWAIMRDIYQVAEYSLESIRENAADDNPNRLKDRLVDLQSGVLSTVFGLIDGVSGPTYWPGIKLVNGVTGENLSEDLQWDLADAEDEYIPSIEPPPDEE